MAGVWGTTGAFFVCLWTLAVASLLREAATATVAIVAVGLVLGAGLFFAAAGYLMATLGNALIARGRRGPDGRRAQRERDGADA